MPTYDYLCPNGHRFEVIHSVTADGPERCPVCGASPVRKAFTAPTIHFKGSGWAKKDRSSTSRSTKAAASHESGDGSSDASGSAGSSAGSETGEGKSTSTPAQNESDAKPASGSSAKGSTTGGGTPAAGGGPAAD